GVCNHRFKPPRAKLTAQLRKNAKGTGMIAALSNLDVGGIPGRSQHARRGFVVKIIGEVGNRAVPVLAGEAPLSRSKIAFRSRLQNLERRVIPSNVLNSRCGKNVFQLAGSNYSIYLRNVLAN